MIPDISDNNLYLLLPGKVSAVVERFVDENNLSLLDGLRMFYNSMTYKNLEQEQTKLWHLGPVALYQTFSDEINNTATLKDLVGGSAIVNNNNIEN